MLKENTIHGEKAELKKFNKMILIYFQNIFNVNDYGFWKEENKYVLIRSISDIEFINE